MALNKIKSTQMGVDGDYHRILQLNCNFDRLDAVCTVGTYVDEAARNAGSTPIATFQIDLADQFHNGNYNDGEDAMKNISLKEGYKALKKMAVDEAAKPVADRRDDLVFFADAEDV
ncbi:hypothetical protein KAR91_21835 [Candidatus Pacearchaeota archaeon]|nr:hypothetical protein [Candidatus Pacearchaeota archaeon]